MTHPNLQISLRVALSVIGLRLVLFYGNFESEWLDTAYIYINLAALPALAIYAIWPRAKATGFLEDAKECLRLLGLYSILMTVFFFVYYNNVDREFFPSMHERITFGEVEAAEGNPDPEEVGQRVRSFFSIRNGTAIVLAAYMAFSLFYAVFFSAVKRVVPGIRK
ncbi:MAG: hypothetical protein ABR572_09910 [Cryomorphaceae bacterium]